VNRRSPFGALGRAPQVHRKQRCKHGHVPERVDRKTIPFAHRCDQPTRHGDSGTLSAAYSTGASPSVIVTPPANTLWWLSPDAGTSQYTAELSLERPRLLEISAFGPLGGLQSAHRTTITQWFVPSQSVDDTLGLVLTLPGLLVQVMRPATHLTITPSSTPYTVSFEASVAMMCGCPIDNKPNNPWVPSDFEVYADIRQLSISPAPVTRITLLFSSKDVPSRYSGEFQFTPRAAPGNKPVFYEAVVTARQKSTSNIGTGTVTFFVLPPA